MRHKTPDDILEHYAPQPKPRTFSHEFMGIVRCIAGIRIVWDFGVPTSTHHCNDIDCNELATWTAIHEDGGWDTYYCNYHKSQRERTN